MRSRLAFVLLVGLWPATVHADARGEMAAALEAQVDTHPAPARLPVTVPAPTRTAAVPVKPVTARAEADASSRAADRVQELVFGLATALLRQTQAATQAAAGQAQSEAGKDRATRRSGR